MRLIKDAIYRRRDLHAAFGGQRQGGISTPSDRILLFTGFSGAQNGYNDGWSEGVFCYFGEGQVGDMPWSRGNKAIRDHQLDNRDLCLFEMLDQPRSHVRFVGTFYAASWEYRQAPDRAGIDRQAIVFHLSRSESLQLEEQTGGLPEDTQGLSLFELQQAAMLQGAEVPKRTVQDALRTIVERAALVKKYARVRSNGICEACDKPAPFTTANNVPFLEVHHIDRLSDGGPDRPDMVAAICPNCHREAHFGQNAEQLNEELTFKIAIK